MLFISPLLQNNDNDDYETIEIRIGQIVKYFSNDGRQRTGEVIQADNVSETVTVITGDILKYKEVVDINDLIEG